MASSSAFPDDLSGYANLSYSTLFGETGTLSSENRGFTQVYDVNWNRPLSPVFGYRLSLKASDSESTSVQDDSSIDSSSTIHFIQG